MLWDRMENVCIEWGMMNNRHIKRIHRLCAGMFLMIASLILFVGMGDRDGEDLCVYLTEVDDGWEICLSSDLRDVAGGRCVAFLISVEVPEGWDAPYVEIGEGARGMRLTVGQDGGRCTILLDGLPEWDGQTLVKLRFSRTGEGRPVPAGDDTLILYRLEAGGDVSKIPIRVDREEREETVLVPSESLTEETEKMDTTEIETDISADEAPTQQKKPPSLPWGCQETVPQGGGYAVRFWFLDTLPVICMEGGGVIFLEQGTSEGWRCVTFRQLKVSRRYVFWVYTPDGIVEIVYEGGEFMGFYSPSSSSSS